MEGIVIVPQALARHSARSAQIIDAASLYRGMGVREIKSTRERQHTNCLAEFGGTIVMTTHPLYIRDGKMATATDSLLKFLYTHIHCSKQLVVINDYMSCGRSYK